MALEEHPYADHLSIVHVFGYICCTLTSQWDGVAPLGAYIPPDSLVPTDRSEFAFLAQEGRTHERIRAKKLRGVTSQGLLIPAPAGAEEGDDVTDALGVLHYDPPVQTTMGGEDCPPPPGYYPVYDVDSWYRYKDVLQDNEQVVITEKLHGTSSRFVFTAGEFHVGAHRNWKLRDDKNLWWQAVVQNSWIETWCRAHPDLTVYAEIYGQVQDLKYGHNKGKYSIAVFDVLRGSEWLSWDDFFIYATCPDDCRNTLQIVPMLYCGPYSEIKIRQLIDGPSIVPGANHLREGVVIRPIKEKTDVRIGRVLLKAVSPEYLSR